ncbi:MAG: hypothetical protein WBD86_00310 [Microgenomates group bacterium]
MPANLIDSPEQKSSFFFEGQKPRLQKILFPVFVIFLLITISLLAYYFYEARQLTARKDALASLEAIDPVNEPVRYMNQLTKIDWKPQNFPITATVLGIVNEQDKILRLEFTWPPQIAEEEGEVKLICDDTDYSVAIPDFPPGETPPDKVPDKISPIEFIEMLKEDNVIFSGFCANKSCKVINKGCILKVL